LRRHGQGRRGQAVETIEITARLEGTTMTLRERAYTLPIWYSAEKE
jgi:hypothetical protein